MAITLYDMEHSPYCVAIRQVLRALGLPWETVWVDNWNRAPVIEVTGGAYYQIPVLVDGDAVVYPGSKVARDISYFLNDRYAGGRLLPKETLGLQEIVIDYIENDLEGIAFRICDPDYQDTVTDLVANTMITRHKERKFGVGCVDQWRRERDSLIRQATSMLMRFETVLQHKAFIFGDQATYADFALYGVLWNMTHLGRDPLPVGLEATSAWRVRLESWRFDA